MGATVGNAAATPQLSQVLGQLQGMGVNTAALLGGGAAAPAAGAAPAVGAQAAAATGTPAQPQPGVTARGASVQVVQDANGKVRLAAPTGLDEKVTLLNPATGQPTGQVLLFNQAGTQVRNFEIVARQPITVQLDQRVGIASGISNLSRIVAQRQERLKGLQEALAQDSNETGNTNQLDIQQLVQEQQVSENINGLNKKIYDSVQEAVRSWLR